MIIVFSVEVDYWMFMLTTISYRPQVEKELLCSQWAMPFLGSQKVYGPFLVVIVTCTLAMFMLTMFDVMCIILTKKLDLVNSSLRLTTATRSAVHPAPWGSSWSELSNRLWWLKIMIMIGCAHYSQPYCGGQALQCPTCVLKIFHFASLHWIYFTYLRLFALICTYLHRSAL